VNKLPPGFAGTAAGPLTQTIDARWLMAYAAALGATEPVHLDTARTGGLLAHPLFPVCYEWPAVLELRAALPSEVAGRGVHATHDLVVHRLPRAGDRLTTTAVVTALCPHRAGALVTTRLETVDADGQPVSTTEYGSIYRDVACEPAETAAVPLAVPPRIPVSAGPRWTATVPVPAGLAHVYSECARIWNPIHTDPAVARAAGLPNVILHGTATLGLAVTEVVRREAAGDPARVRRITGRFGAMVGLPSTLTVDGLGVVEVAGGTGVAFRVVTVDGRPAVRDGRVLLATRPI
jgi:acyl dehydratase